MKVNIRMFLQSVISVTAKGKVGWWGRGEEGRKEETERQTDRDREGLQD